MLPVHKTLKTVFNYDEIPPGYYYTAMREGSPIQRFWHRRKFAHVARLIPDGASVLDFGCGAGSFLAVLGEERPSVRAVGVDIGSSQIDFANREVAKLFPGGRITFEALPAASGVVPHPDGAFDVVTVIEVIEHLHPAIAHRFLREARRLLKPGGRLIVTTPNYRSLWPLIEVVLERMSPVKYHEQHINKFTPSSLVKFVESGGFEIQAVSTIFISAPFLAPISVALADAVHRIETAVQLHAGSLLVVEATPLPASEPGF
jgi:2-polyprenyl-3-methyl-5-hydroxy-6-metoxy-1,4-benzoquinol methylase